MVMVEVKAVVPVESLRATVLYSIKISNRS